MTRAGGFVLAGGESTRMGQNKALLTLNGELLVERAVRRLREVCADVAIAGGTEALARFGRVVPDRRSGCGPLSGIVAALEQSAFEWNLFAAVDAPFVPVRVFEQLLAETDGFAGVCVMARCEELKQPLCAVYAKTALETLRIELDTGRWKVTQAIAAAGAVKYVDFEEMGWFANLNTPEEFAEALRLSEE